MKSADIEIGGCYVAKVSNALTIVRITGLSPYGKGWGKGWEAINTATNRAVRIRSAARLRRRVLSTVE